MQFTFSSSVLFFVVLLSAAISAIGDDPKMSAPRRRLLDRFNNPVEYSKYMKKLMNYYDTISRGRYGKRQMPTSFNPPFLDYPAYNMQYRRALDNY